MLKMTVISFSLNFVLFNSLIFYVFLFLNHNLFECVSFDCTRTVLLKFCIHSIKHEFIILLFCVERQQKKKKKKRRLYFLMICIIKLSKFCLIVINLRETKLATRQLNEMDENMFLNVSKLLKLHFNQQQQQQQIEQKTKNQTIVQSSKEKMKKRKKKMSKKSRLSV